MIETLRKYGQEHILSYYESLSREQKEKLEQQLSRMDLTVLERLDQQTEEKRGAFMPLGALTIEEIRSKEKLYMLQGLNALQNGKVGAVLLAGGQGTRLGLHGPKGTLNVGVTRELYLFECLVQNLLQVVKHCGSWVPLYVMTSEKNNQDTIAFFQAHKYFGYDSSQVHFFVQEMAPCTDFEGKMMLETPEAVCSSPNGNGGWFSSMVRAGLLKDLKSRGVEWLNVFAVDNVLQQIADPCFIGATIASGCEAGAKVVAKADPDERVGVLCLEDGKPSIVEYYEMTDEMRTLREPGGRLSYNYGVILNYLFRVEKLQKIMDQRMPVHLVKKKIPYLNEQGQRVEPEAPNGYKFETLVLDMVHMQDSCLSYEVKRNKEFAPIKNATGVDSLESARELLKQNGVTL